MTVKKGQEIVLGIDHVAFGGLGIARVDGLAVFVDQAVPGDQVLARIVKKKKKFAQARILELQNPSAQRVAAPCLYSGVCGGCKWQFLDYHHQLLYKQQHVQESLIHIGQLPDVVVHPTLPSKHIFGYRNKMEFSCATQRWLLPEELGCEGVDAGIAVGLHVPGTYYKVLDIEACLLQPALGNQLLADVREYILASQQPVYGLKSHQGFWRFLVLRHSVANNHWMVNLVTAYEDRPTVQKIADQLFMKYPEVVSVVNNITARKAGVALGEYETTLKGTSVIVDAIGPYSFELSANSFFQTNTAGAQILYDTIQEYTGLTGKEVVLDLYCGAGTIAIYLAERAKTVIGMEMIASAVNDAVCNCRRNHIENCRFIEGDIRFTLKELDIRPNVIVIDPPRSGMHPDVANQVMTLAPEKVVYVSCNPATLARDLNLMKDDYTVVEVQPVDMFPHTFHIESVAKLIRKSV